MALKVKLPEQNKQFFERPFFEMKHFTADIFGLNFHSTFTAMRNTLPQTNT